MNALFWFSQLLGFTYMYIHTTSLFLWRDAEQDTYNAPASVYIFRISFDHTKQGSSNIYTFVTMT